MKIRVDEKFNSLVEEWLSEKFSTTSKFFVTKLTTPSDRARRTEQKTFSDLPHSLEILKVRKMGVFVSNYYRIGALTRPCTEPLNSSK